MARFTPKERRAYDLNLQRIWDNYAALDTSYQRGAKKGEENGIKKGIKRGEIKALLILLNQKLGSVPSEIEKSIKALDNIDQINEILSRIFEIDSWETLKKYLPD